MGRTRILLGQLISNGDCLYATAIARQIKRDFPGCHLTWAISSLCRQVIERNPFVDEIWEIPLAAWHGDSIQNSWHDFEAEALRRYESGRYSFIFFTQITIGNPHHFDGTVRPGIFRGYPGRITVPLAPSLRLRPDEVEKVAAFAKETGLASYDRVILFECSSKSGQSQINPEQAYKIAEELIQLKLEKLAIVLCSHHAVSQPTPNIIDGSRLSLRETAELTRYCHLLIGCSSGITCICTSSAAKRLPMIQLLNHECATLGSLAHDYEFFGLPTDHLIEMYDYRLESVTACYKYMVQAGWENSRYKFHQQASLKFSQYLGFIRHTMYSRGDFYGTCVSLEITTNRYGWRKKLRSFVRRMARKHLGLKSLFWSARKKLARLKAHFQNPAFFSMVDSAAPYLPHFSVWRPCTCEVSLEKSFSDYRKLLRTQCPASLHLLFNRGSIVRRIMQKGGSAELKEKCREKYRPPIYAIAYALSLFESKDFHESYRVLSDLRTAGADCFCQELEWLYADLCWICGDLEVALPVYRECLRKNPANPKLIRLIGHLQNCIRGPELQGPAEAQEPVHRD
jgi:hypothetical protein